MARALFPEVDSSLYITFSMLDLCIIIKQARRHLVVTSRARERDGEKEKENGSDEALEVAPG